MVAILMFIVGVIILSVVHSGWGVVIIILGVLLLIAAGIVGFVSSTRKAAIDALNSPAGAELVRQIPTLVAAGGAEGLAGLAGTLGGSGGSLAQVLTGVVGGQGTGGLPRVAPPRAPVGSPRITH